MTQRSGVEPRGEIRAEEWTVEIDGEVEVSFATVGSGTQLRAHRCHGNYEHNTRHLSTTISSTWIMEYAQEAVKRKWVKASSPTLTHSLTHSQTD